MVNFPPIKRTPALMFLVAVNLIPVFGVLMFGWNIAMIIVLYWLETVIIGIINVPKIWACEGSAGMKLFITIFFAFHFGMFSWGHYMFLGDMFKAGNILGGLKDGGPIVWAAVSLFISHLFSLFVNFFGHREYAGRDANMQMFFPYGRIVVMHIFIIFGGAIALLLGSPMIALLILIVLKIVMDIIAHSFEHGGKPLHMMR